MFWFWYGADMLKVLKGFVISVLSIWLWGALWSGSCRPAVEGLCESWENGGR